MNTNGALGCLETKWRDYLKERGHQFSHEARHFTVLISRNHKKQRYRWLLLPSAGHSKLTLGKSCQAEIHYHLRQAKARKETTYIVVGFTKEPGRIIVLPANAALKARCIRSDKGGIAWDD
ncbi:MAG: hypothetical protein NTX52_06385 [Planctomycetota bacterium]|nr:hypothetical protein [Planctomycetota bacterium]